MPLASTSKDQLRSRFRDVRRSVSPDEYTAWSTLIATRVMSLRVISEASVVHAYWPQIQNGEIDTRPLIAALRSQEISVALPVVTSYDPSSPAMEHRLLDHPDAMRENRWGILEPVDTDLVEVSTIDAVIVPALGAGRNGHRIGYGAGYYDSFLQHVDVPKIGLVYDECLVPTIDPDPHDVPLTLIVTEKETIHVPDPTE